MEPDVVKQHVITIAQHEVARIRALSGVMPADPLQWDAHPDGNNPHVWIVHCWTQLNPAFPIPPATSLFEVRVDTNRAKVLSSQLYGGA